MAKQTEKYEKIAKIGHVTRKHIKFLFLRPDTLSFDEVYVFNLFFIRVLLGRCSKRDVEPTPR